MITVVARWDSIQMEAELEWRIWRQIKGAFAVDRFVFVPIVSEMLTVLVDQYDTMEEALATCKGKHCFLEQGGSDSLFEIPTFGDVTIIVGNTLADNKLSVQADDLQIEIVSAKPTSLYGFNAAAIALAIRLGQ